MNLITCSGYGDTGSSVVSDLLKEFSDVKSYGDFEFRFLQDPCGLRDLEYGLFENNNRLNTGFYIDKFIKFNAHLSKSKRYKYEHYFNQNFKKLTDEFINDIIDVQWNGYWHRDIIDANPLKKASYSLFNNIHKLIIKKILKQFYTKKNFFNNQMYYARCNDKKDFYAKSKTYTAKLINAMEIDEKYNFAVLDQLTPPDNNKTYMNYFDNLKIIIIDRDPRDLFLLQKYEYKEKWVPFDDIEKFTKWFRLIREHKKSEIKNSNVMYMQFEDFIYDYENTIDKVIDFIGLDKDKWLNKKAFFNPDISIKNTKKWLMYPQAKKEIKYIEANLKEFLIKEYL